MTIHEFLDMVIHTCCLVGWIFVGWDETGHVIFLFDWMDEDGQADDVMRDPLVIYLILTKI